MSDCHGGGGCGGRSPQQGFWMARRIRIGVSSGENPPLVTRAPTYSSCDRTFPFQCHPVPSFRSQWEGILPSIIDSFSAAPNSPYTFELVPYDLDVLSQHAGYLFGGRNHSDPVPWTCC